MTKYGLTNGLLRTAPAIALAAAVTLTAATDARAGHQWGSYHWKRDGGPADLTVGNNHVSTTGNDGTIESQNINCGDLLEGCPDWFNLVTNGASGIASEDPWTAYDSIGVVDEWNDPDLLLNSDVLGDRVSVSIGTPESSNIESYNDNYGDNNWLGIAYIWVTRGKNKHITRSEIRMNDYYVPEPYLGGQPYRGFNEKVEWLAVACQELGHALALNHTLGNTCMNTDVRPLRHATPNYHDYEELYWIYEHDHGDGGGVDGGTAKPCNKKGKPAGCVSSGASRGHVVWAEHYETEADMFNAADLVVGATVLSSGFDRMAGRGAGAVPMTHVVLKVSDWEKGQSRPVIILEQTRGPGFEIEEDPGYVTGDDYVLYLREIGANTYRTVNPDGRILQ